MSQCHMMLLDIISYDPDPKVKGQIMYFLVNDSPPKQLDKATCRCIGDMMQRVLGNIL